jgi:AcrR family transcriptional regulator
VTFTIDAIAEKADVARMTVYNQFGSKRGLVEALSDELAKRGGITRLPAAFQAEDGASGLNLLIDVFTGFWERERLAIQRLRAFTALDPELAGYNRDVLRRQAISTVLERFVKSQHPTSPERERLIDLLWVLTGFESYELLSAGGRSAKDVASIIKSTSRELLAAKPGLTRREGAKENGSQR